jgi:predicted RND superfamily exporter protein
MFRLLKAGLTGGIVLFIWYSISWTMLSWHQKTFTSLPFGDVIIQTMLEGNVHLNEDSLDSEIYIAPQAIDYKSKDKSGYDKKAFAFIALSPNGLKPMNEQLLFFFISETLLAFLMSLVIILVDSFKVIKNYSIVVLISVIVALGYALPANNWWGFSFDYLKVEVIDIIIAWALAGIPIAYFARRID